MSKDSGGTAASIWTGWASLERGGGGGTGGRKVCPKPVIHLDGNTNTKANKKTNRQTNKYNSNAIKVWASPEKVGGM